MARSAVVTMALLLLVAVWGGSAHAMSAYARTFSMKCGDCHKQRIPELNDFGIAFYKNGFILPGDNQQKPTKTENEASATGTPTPPSTTSPNKGEGDEDSDEDNEEEQPEKKPEPPPLVVYRWESSDGSIHYTDDPLLRERLGNKATAGEAARHAKSDRRHRQGKIPATPGNPSPRYRSYQECMERQLEGASQGSAQEVMELFIRAERTCGGRKQGKK